MGERATRLASQFERANAGLIAAIRGCDDASLGNRAQFFGREMTAAGLIEHVLIGHVYEHGAGIRAALAAEAMGDPRERGG